MLVLRPQVQAKSRSKQASAVLAKVSFISFLFFNRFIVSYKSTKSYICVCLILLRSDRTSREVVIIDSGGVAHGTAAGAVVAAMVAAGAAVVVAAVAGTLEC